MWHWWNDTDLGILKCFEKEKCTSGTSCTINRLQIGLMSNLSCLSESGMLL